MTEKKTIFGKIFQAIIDVFAGNWQSFVAKLWNKVPDDVKEKVNVGIRVVELFKKFVESPTADFITAIIPGDLDDKLKEHLREWFEKWPELKDHDVNEPSHMHSLATIINKELTGLSFGQAALTTEVAYQNFKKNS